MRRILPPSDKIYPKHVSTERAVQRWPARPLISRVGDWPTGMFAGIDAIEHSVMNGDIMRITGPGNELNQLCNLAGLDIVLDQFGVYPG